MPEAKTFAIEKDERGRTILTGEASGSEARSGLLGGLYRNRLLTDVLDRAAAIAPGTSAVLVVEGSTDEDYLRLATQRAGRTDLLKDLGIIQAGAGVNSSHAGGASLVVMQALIAHATLGIPVAALLDDDREGREASASLRVIGNKTGYWKKNRSVFSYASILDPGADFEFEAEDLWPNALFEAFLAQQGETGVLKRKEQRPKSVGGWQYDLAPASKARFVEFLRDHVKPEQCHLWVQLLELIRDGLRLPKAKTDAGTPPASATDVEIVQSTERSGDEAKPVEDTRRGSLWPLPGGLKAWKDTLDEMVRHLADQGPVSIDVGAAWLEGRHKRLRSHRLAVDYWLVPAAIGFVERSGGRFSLTSSGIDYAESLEEQDLSKAILANVWGAQELLDYLRANESSTDELLDLMRQLGAKWQTDSQVIYRLRWLQLCGLVELNEGSWRTVDRR